MSLCLLHLVDVTSLLVIGDFDDLALPARLDRVLDVHDCAD
jgi:hypothetical protein